MSTAVTSSEAFLTRAGTLWATAWAGLRVAPCVLLALLIGVLNPAFCLLHCYLAHGPQTAHYASHAHASHSHPAGVPGGDSDVAGCGHTSLPSTAQLTPRAFYELVPAGLLLAMLVFTISAHLPCAPWRPGPAASPQPPTPPPQTLAFV